MEAAGGCGVTHACQLENFGSQVLEHCGNVDGRLGANAHLVLRVGLEETLDTSTGKLDSVGWSVIADARRY